PLGTDFSNVYAAGTYVLEGNPAAPFDPRLQHAREQAIFGANTPFYGWHYPPFFLAVASALALLPYQLALIVWQGVTLVLYLWATRSIVQLLSCPGLSRASTTFASSEKQDVDGWDKPGHDGVWLLLALAYPAVFVN